VRITESLGVQSVEIPDLTGQTERSATIGIRRLSLELGAVAHLAIAGDPDVVLTQTPPADVGGVDGPRVSLLVSDAIPGDTQAPAYVMPSLVGLSYSAANARAASAGLHLVAVTENALPTAVPATAMVAAPSASAAQNGVPAPATGHSSGIVTAQSPQAGRRVVQGDVVHVTLGHSATPNAVPVASQ
jgi:beta-lactam-binding protein with PASTA domain